MTEQSIEPALEPTFPDAEAFGKLVAPRTPRHRALKRLHELAAQCNPDAELSERVLVIEKFAAFVRSGRKVPPLESAFEAEAQPVLRLRLLVQALEVVPDFRRRVASLLASVLAESVEGGLFARVGLPTDRGFLAETVDRVSRRFLPEPKNPRDLSVLVGGIVPRRPELRVVTSLPPELVARFVRLLVVPERGIDPWEPVRAHLLDAIALIPMRISAVGLSDVIRSRSPKVRPFGSPFFKLPRAVDVLIERARSASSGALAAEEFRAQAVLCRELGLECASVMNAVVDNLERYGVSVDVVYRLELIQRNLDRLARLIAQLEPAPELERATRARGLLAELVAVRLQDRALRAIIAGNLHLLARKIIERAGHTGEHYITSTAQEYWKMLLSAGGGGVLTCGTTALKYLIAWQHFAPFVEGILSAANYAGSFIVMQLLGFTLATKQPSMTAAALAGTLRETASHPDLSALVTMIARIVRSQLAAAVGNIGLVIPAAIAFDYVWRSRTGSSFLDAETAQYVLGSLHPTHSGTIFYAAFTGVLLWISSIFAGWVENWAVYRRLPQAIVDHGWGRLFGRRVMGALSRFFVRNIAGFGGNSALGFLLGMTPVFGKFFGLPLDVRHVTLSTGALTLSVCALGPDATPPNAVFHAAIGIGIIGALNFGVSFVLALAVALRAREVARSDRLRLLLSVIATFARSPLQFFWPPRSASEPAVHGPVSVNPEPR